MIKFEEQCLDSIKSYIRTNLFILQTNDSLNQTFHHMISSGETLHSPVSIVVKNLTYEEYLDKFISQSVVLKSISFVREYGNCIRSENANVEFGDAMSKLYLQVEIPIIPKVLMNIILQYAQLSLLFYDESKFPRVLLVSSFSSRLFIFREITRNSWMFNIACGKILVEWGKITPCSNCEEHLEQDCDQCDNSRVEDNEIILYLHETPSTFSTFEFNKYF